MSNKTKSGHTGSPWKWRNYRLVGGEFGRVICNAAEIGRDIQGDEQDDANQRLLAVAPDVFMALEMLYKENADYITVNHLGDVHHNHSMRMARDVIARVKGGGL